MQLCPNMIIRYLFFIVTEGKFLVKKDNNNVPLMVQDRKMN